MGTYIIRDVFNLLRERWRKGLGMEHEGCYGCGCLARRLADAQATVEALQAKYELECAGTKSKLERMQTLQQQVEALQRERDALKLVNETHMKTVMKLSHIVEQSGAALTPQGGKGWANGTI